MQKNLSDLYTLRNAEKALKGIYETNSRYREKAPSITLLDELNQVFQMTGRNMDDIFKVFNKEISKSLLESEYFEETIDAAVIQHVRYMPPIYHKDDFFEAEYVLQGEVTAFVEDTVITMDAGTILIVAPDANHSACTFNDDAIMLNFLIRKSTFEQRFMNILPDSDLLKSFFTKSLYGQKSQSYLQFNCGEDERLMSLALDIKQEYDRNNRYKNTMLSSLLSVFFVELVRKHEKDVIIPMNSGFVVNENTIFILEYLQKNYANITLSHLSDFFNYSQRQMQRILIAATGMGFSANVKKLRMEHAREYLINTDLPVSKISEELGFYDSSSFRQAFKKYYDMTPQEFRNSNNRGRG